MRKMFIIIDKSKLYISIGCFILIGIILLLVTHNYIHAISIEAPQVDVVLDAGHGGFDGGASGAKGALEKDINLAITLKLREKLITEGISVGLTRESESAVGSTKKKDMHFRRDFTNASNPKIFITIHQNAFPSSTESGAQIWYSKNNPESKNFGSNMQTALKEINPQNRRIEKQADSSMFLLKHLTMPAILIECGFLSSPEEEQLLTQDNYQEKFTEVLKKGILTELERLKTIPTPSTVPTTPIISPQTSN